MCMHMFPAAPKSANVELGALQIACQPLFEQMLLRISSNADVLGQVQPIVSQQLIETLCQPYFQQIAEKLHEELMSSEKQCSMDEDRSTDAEEGSAFSCLFSGQSSDVEACDVDSWSEARYSPSASPKDSTGSSPEAEKNVVVCRHWKSKGWCRMESQCKFSHPEHKRGVTSIIVESTSVELSACAAKCLKKRAGKNRSRKTNAEQVGPLVSTSTVCFPCISMPAVSVTGVW